MALPIYQVDSFTREPFRGNPAAVTLYENPRPDAWMMALAAEMNLSETAFLTPADDGYRLRWFTPKVEVSLCGHATLASAHILWERRYLPEDEVAIFDTLSGRLTCRLEDDWIVMDFPARPVEAEPEPQGLREALGIGQPVFVGRYKNNLLVELDDEAAVSALAPNTAGVEALPYRAVSVTARGSGEFDFVSRFFAPKMGIAEDPVTGSAHTGLAPYWGNKLGKAEMTAFQASARGGVLRVRPLGERVEILGQALTVFAGELFAAE